MRVDLFECMTAVAVGWRALKPITPVPTGAREVGCEDEGDWRLDEHSKSADVEERQPTRCRPSGSHLCLPDFDPAGSIPADFGRGVPRVTIRRHARKIQRSSG